MNQQDNNTQKEENQYNTVDPTDDGVQGAKHILYQTTWKTEALQIPLEDLTDNLERQLVAKCINGDPVNDDELTILEDVLQRYRKAIQEQQPLETIENYEANVEYVDSEQAFLELLDEEEKESELTFYYPLASGKEARIDLTVKPLTDAQAVIEVTDNLQIFNDYTEEETRAFGDYQAGRAQTPEEIAVAKRIETQLATMNAGRVQQAAVEFLSLQTSFKGRDSSYEDMKRIYSRMNVAVLLLLFKRVQDITQMNNLDVEKIFR